MANIQLSIINACSVLTDDQCKPVVAALQIQVTRDFAPAWGIDADLHFVAKDENPDPTHWWLVLLDNSDVAGALGYHDLTSTGLPIGKVFVKTDIDNNLSWSVTASHELLEILSDPDINLTTFVQTSGTAGFLFAFENCDAVEDDQYGYDINGIKMSDFVLPAYFQRSMPATKWDFCGHLKGPIPEMLPGGYLSQFIIGMPGQQGWSQIHAQVAPTCQHIINRTTRMTPGSRKMKRGLDRTGWKNSTI
jgi:hypothetical protein